MNQNNRSLTKEEINEIIEDTLQLNNSKYYLLMSNKRMGNLSLKDDFNKVNIEDLLNEGKSTQDICELFDLSKETFEYLISVLNINININVEKRLVKLLATIPYKNSEDGLFFGMMHEALNLGNSYLNNDLIMFLNDTLKKYAFETIKGINQYAKYANKLFFPISNETGFHIAIYDIYSYDYFNIPNDFVLE